MKVKIILFAIICICVFGDDGQHFTGPCPSLGGIPLKYTETRKITKMAKVTSSLHVKYNLKSFCRWNRMDRVAKQLLYSEKPEVLEDRLNQYRALKDEGKIDEAAELLLSFNNMPIDKELAPSPWIASLSGHPKLKREDVPTLFEKTRSKAFGKYPNEKNQDHLWKLFASEMVSDLGKDYDSHYKIETDDFTVKMQPRQSRSKVKTACMYFSVIGSGKCKDAVNSMYKYIDIYTHKEGGSKLVALPIVVDILSNEKITKALKEVSVNIWKRIEKNKFSNSDNIFDELVTSLEKYGFEKDEARETAVNALTVMATGGANYASRHTDQSRFPHECGGERPCNMNHIYLSAISEGMYVADTIKIENNEPSLYSLPKEHSFPCDSGKSYHYWMAVGLTQKLIKEGHSPEAAAKAVYLSQMGYQTNRLIQIPGLKKRESPRFGTLEHASRIDLVLSAAGTRFAIDITANDENPTRQSLKDGLEALILDGGNRPNREEGTEGTSGIWKQREFLKDFSPKSALDFFNP